MYRVRIGLYVTEMQTTQLPELDRECGTCEGNGVHIGPNIGLPELPVVHFGLSETRKSPALVRYAAGCPFAWVDDEITGWDFNYVGSHHQGRSRLHPVLPRLGLLDDDFRELRAWAASLNSHEVDGGEQDA